ncbi:RrF2 family transcriptional regulator [Hoeflea sp.]|uniref:RrF2 family transcriptional regulator n=1 Tax=Hoeflea sp. TaxID=1940281 RepID=UPI003A8CF448
MRLTTRTSLATRVLIFCATHEGQVVKTSDIARAYDASSHHLGHVIHQLQHHGYVSTFRGRAGGLMLNKKPRDISIGRLFRIFEAGATVTGCFASTDNSCPLIADCRLRDFLTRAVEAFYRELDPITLDDLVRDNCGLETILKMAPDRSARCPTAA